MLRANLQRIAALLCGTWMAITFSGGVSDWIAVFEEARKAMKKKPVSESMAREKAKE